MAKMVRLILSVAADKVAETLELLADVSDDIRMQRSDATDTTDDGEDEEPIVNVRKRDVRRVNVAPVTNGRQPAPRTRMAGKVIYTPVGTAKQIAKTLDSLRGQSTMRALVLRDLAKHPGSSNKEVRGRVESSAKKAGLSVESVDNVIWQMVNKGLISKAAEAAD